MVARRNLLVSKLGTNIAHIHILQGLMSLQITDLHNKWVRAIVLAVNKQLSHDNRMVGGATERSNPPLGGSQCGRVNGEGLIAGVPGGSGFETADIGSVTQLGLCVAADDFVFLSALEEQLVLLGGALFPEGHLEDGKPVSVVQWLRGFDHLPGTYWRASHRVWVLRSTH